MQQMMKQAGALQKKVTDVQEELEKMEIEGVSGAGMVKVIMTGKNDVKSIKIDPSLIVPEDKEMLEDLIVAALHNAKTNLDSKMKEKMDTIGIPPNLSGIFG